MLVGQFRKAGKRAALGRRIPAPALRAAALPLLLLAAGCAVGPPKAPIELAPAAEAPVWPTAPETPRYVFVRTLIGERDFLDKGSETTEDVQSALRWLAGLVVGEPEYEELQRPVSGMTGADGRVFVIDASHKAVMVFDLRGANLSKWELAAEALRFVAPIAIAPDGAGGYLVTDAELAEVFRLDGSGRAIGRFGAGVLSRPTGIAHDPMTGDVYVADTEQHDIKVFDAAGNLVELIGSRGNGEGLFNSPTHLSFEGGRLYVADTLNFRVQVFDRTGDERLTFGRIGLFVGNMTRPKGVAVGSGQRIYVVESYFDHLLVYDQQGQLLLPIGGTGREIGQFYLPSGVWTDAQGRVYVADMFNGRVVIFQELGGESVP